MENDKTVRIMKEIIRSIRLRELFYSKLAEVRNKTAELQREQAVQKKNEKKITAEKENNTEKTDEIKNSRLKNVSEQNAVKKEGQGPVDKSEAREEKGGIDEKPDIRGHKLDFNA